jgi:hypothetical protein
MGVILVMDIDRMQALAGMHQQATHNDEPDIIDEAGIGGLSGEDWQRTKDEIEHVAGQLREMSTEMSTMGKPNRAAVIDKLAISLERLCSEQ